MPTIWNKVEDIQWQLQMQAVHLWHARNFIQHSTNDHGWNQSATSFSQNELQVDTTIQNCPTVDYSVSCEIVYLHGEIHGFLIMAERNSWTPVGCSNSALHLLCLSRQFSPNA